MKEVEKVKKNGSSSLIRLHRKQNFKNVGLLGLIGTSTIACNATQDDQCLAGFGVIIGSFCANQNDVVVNTEVKLTEFTSKDDFILSSALDNQGNKKADTIVFKNKNDVIGTKYTLTDGDILENPGTVFLNFINSGSIDGQTIYNADEIELTTQGTTVVLTTDWFNNDVITIKDSDQSVTLNDLQASKLDSAIAEDNMFYPSTNYRIEDVQAASSVISFYFNEAAILGTSTELDLSVKDSNVGLQAAVFVNPNAEVDNGALDEQVDPFLVEADTNIEKLNLEIADTNSVGSVITDLDYTGLEILSLSGGTRDYDFEITNPLEPSLREIHASNIPANLTLDVSESILVKKITLGSGDDVLSVGNSLVASPDSDLLDGGDGLDKILISFEGATTARPNLSSFEALDLASAGDSILDFTDISNLDTLSILESSAGIALTNLPFDLTKFNVAGPQTGAWSLSFVDNSDSTVNLNWSNNTGNNVAITGLDLNEVQSLSFTSDGANEVNLAALSVDSDDTKLISMTNIGDGNLIISSDTQLDTFDAVTAIVLTATEGGSISVGSADSNFGISDASKISTLNLVASETGSVEIGSIGTNTSVEDFQTISITSSGANVSIGSIAASNVGTLSAAISSSGIVSIGDLTFENAGTSLVATGSGTLNSLNFTKEAYSIIDLTDLNTNTTTSFINAENGVTISLGSGNDTVEFGLGTDIVTGNGGADIFVIGNGSSGILATTADVIKDFQPGTDKLKLGLLGDQTSDTGNYVESLSSVANFSEALTAANLALEALNSTSAALELYSFQYDSNYGYLFVDTDSDGIADELVILDGMESSMISPTDIVA